jgi:hypothetical protein
LTQNVLALGALGERGERMRFGVTERHQAITDQNEGDRARFRQFRLGARHDRRGHEGAFAFLVKTTGRLDFTHFFTGRHVDGKRPLDRTLLIRRRTEEIDPYDVVSKLESLKEIGGRNGAFTARVDEYHDTAPNSQMGCGPPVV